MKNSKINQIIKKISVAYWKTENFWTKVLSEFWLTPMSFKILNVASDNDNVTPSLIRNRVWWTLSNISQRLDFLEKQLLIKRIYSKQRKDRRKTVIVLTAKWKDIYVKAWEKTSILSKVFAKDFDDKNLEIFLSYLDKYINCLDNTEK